MGDRVFGGRRSSVEFCWTETIAIAAQESMVTIRCRVLDFIIPPSTFSQLLSF
jgi:hypothetical protein